MTLPTHDGWVVGHELYSLLQRGALPGVQKHFASGITIEASAWLPNDKIILKNRGQYAGMIILEYPYSPEDALKEAWAGGDPVVWS